MKKIKMYIIPIAVITLFVAIMTSGGFLKKPFSNIDDVSKSIEILKNDVMGENWKQAEASLENLKTAWAIVEKRVQFSVERNEINLINTNIARIQGARAVKDKSFIIIELSEITEHWKDLEK